MLCLNEGFILFSGLYVHTNKKAGPNLAPLLKLVLTVLCPCIMSFWAKTNLRRSANLNGSQNEF